MRLPDGFCASCNYSLCWLSECVFYFPEIWMRAELISCLPQSYQVWIPCPGHLTALVCAGAKRQSLKAMRKFLSSAWLDSSWKREAPWHARAQLDSSQWLLSASENLLFLSPNLSGHLPADADLCSSHIPHRRCQTKHPAGTFTSRPFLSCLSRTKGAHSFHICCPGVSACKFSLLWQSRVAYMTGCDYL